MNSPQRIDAIVFDAGGVLLDWDPRHLYRKLIDDEAAMDHFLAEVCTPEWHRQHDCGVPVEDTCAELAAAHPEHSELIWAWARRSDEMVSGPIEGSVEILCELKKGGLACYLLTNMETYTWPLRLARFPFLKCFDGAVVSGFEGVAKPDAEIFERLLARFDLTPSRTVFIDDSSRNLDTARQLGLQTVHFHSPHQLRQRLVDAQILAAH